jgi:membrane protein implicated in regulation of membrane protease activity
VPINLNDWLGDHSFWLWTLLAVLLLTLQLFRRDLRFTGLALVAEVTAVVALLQPDHPYAPLVLFGLLALVSLAVTSRLSRRATPGPTVDNSVQADEVINKTPSN